MYKSEWELKNIIIEIGKRLWTRGYVASNDGNISVKINDDEILATPTGVSKGFMTSEMIIKVNTKSGSLVRKSKYKPSSEIKMHLEAYRERKDIQAIIHAHPPYCTSFAVAGIPLDKCILPEAIITFGAVPIAPYGTPSTPEIPETIKPYIQNTDAVLLANHGALILGVDLMNCYFKMETLEHSSQIIFQASQLGRINFLQEDDVKKLMDVREKMNLPGKIFQCQYPVQNEKDKTVDDVIDKITDEVMSRLKDKKK